MNQGNNFTFARETKYIFYMILICSFLRMTKVAYINYLGNIGVYMSSVFYILSALFVLANKRKEKNKIVYTFFLIFIFWLLFNSFENYLLRGIINTYEVIVALGIFYTWLNVKFVLDDRLVKNVFMFLRFVLVVNIFYLVVNIRNFRFLEYPSFYLNADYFGELMSLFAMLAFCLYVGRKDRRFLKLYFSFIPFIVMSGSRTWIIVNLGVMIIFKCSKLLRTTRFIWNLAFVIFYMLMGIFVYVYSYAGVTDWGRKLNTLSITYLNKQFFSGRNLIWMNVIDLIEKNPLVGYGTGALYGNFVDDTRSIHSYFLQLLFQNGLIGLLIFIILTFVIWNKMFRGNKMVHFGSACMMGFLLSNFLEVSILQNQMTFVCLMWMIIAIGYRGDMKDTE